MALLRRWVLGMLTDAQALPIAFSLDGRPWHGIPAGWQLEVRDERLDALLQRRIWKGLDPESGLSMTVEATWYQDFACVEWQARFTNHGDAPSALIEQLAALDGAFGGHNAVLEHGNGDYYDAAGYEMEFTTLQHQETLTIAPRGGRPCDGAFPYMRLIYPGCGLTLAIGWPGQWQAEFTGHTEGARVRIGQQELAASLEPGETIITPRITLLAWQGERERSVNQWRRWYLAHILPRPDGRPIPPCWVGCAPGDGEEWTASTEANQLEWQNLHAEKGMTYDVWWIDAGWYPCWLGEERKWWHTGHWREDPERYPRGFRPVSENLARRGAKLLVWFEPERVHTGGLLELEHPEWLLRAEEDPDNALLNLGNPAALNWLIEHVSGIIQRGGIGIYRQDFNFAPLPHWRADRTPTRLGMAENLHVQGYLAYWDALLARNPGLWIDSCSSGGRRNDLETMRRSVPLHYSDWGYGDHAVKLAFQHRLHEWLPYYKEAALSWDLTGQHRMESQVDPFSYYCAMGPMIFSSIDVRCEGLNVALHNQLQAVWRRAVPYIHMGDYYALTEFEKRADRWLGWQFHNPCDGSGMLQAIRLQEAPEASCTLRLRALDADAGYRLEQAETGEVRTMTGRALMETGVTLEMPARSGAIWLYQRMV